MATSGFMSTSDNDYLLGSDSDDVQFKPVVLKTMKSGIDTVTSIAFGKDKHIGYYALICYSNRELAAFSQRGVFIKDVTFESFLKCEEYNIYDISWMPGVGEITYEDSEITHRSATQLSIVILNNIPGLNSSFLHMCNFDSEIFSGYLSTPEISSDEMHKLENPYGHIAVGLCFLKYEDGVITLAISFVESQSYNVNPRSRRYAAIYEDFENDCVLTIEYKDAKKAERLFTYPKRLSKSNLGDLWVVDRKSPSSGDVKVLNISQDCRGFGHIFTYSGNPGSTFDPMDVKANQDVMVISDCSNHRIHLVKNDGTFVMHVMAGSQGLQYPRALCVDVFDRIWVGCNDGTVHILKYRTKFEA